MPRGIDFYFSISSTYTYLTVMRMEDAMRSARAVGVPVNWRVFNVRQIMIEMENSPFIGKPEKERYMWRDIERRARRYGLPFPEEGSGYPDYPVDPDLLGGKLGALAAHEGWIREFAKASYRAWFLDGLGTGTPEGLTAVLEALDKPVEETLERAETEGAELFDAATEDARKLGIFGSPNFVVGGELFWGDDRLEDALIWAQREG